MAVEQARILLNLGRRILPTARMVHRAQVTKNARERGSSRAQGAAVHRVKKGEMEKKHIQADWEREKKREGDVDVHVAKYVPRQQNHSLKPP